MNGFRYTFIILLLLNAPFAFSQVVASIILDYDKNEPISYANIQIVDSKKGTASNKAGCFVLNDIKGKMDSVRISAIGYQSRTLSIDQVSDTLFLQPKVFELSELKVYPIGLSANDIVRMAMGGIGKRTFNKAYSMKAFYRHYCSENETYGRLIEAAVEINDHKGHKKRCNAPNEKLGVSVLELRKSFDYTKNFDEHDPISIFGTLKYDVTSYTSFLHFYPEDFNFEIIDTSYFDNALVWVISYQFKKANTHASDSSTITCNGELYIDAIDFGIVKVSEEQLHEQKLEYEIHRSEVKWEVRYQKYNGKYFLKYLTESGFNEDELRNTEQEIVSLKDHKFKVEMMISDILLNDFESIKSKEPTKEQLDGMEYNPEFWKTYSILEDTPLNDTITNDLNARKNIDLQFEGEK